MDADEFDAALAEAFDAGAGERRAVARMAADLAATGRYAAVAGHDLTPEAVVRNLQDAPDDGLASCWNWWLGSLELAFGGIGTVGGAEEDGADSDDGPSQGGFAGFQVRRFESDGTDG